MNNLCTSVWRFRKQITQHPTQWLKQSFKTTMKQFCGLGKEEPLSSWSNSKHPLTIIHRVVSDFWKSEVLKNNRIWKISSSSSFLPSLWQQTPPWDENTPDKRRVFCSELWDCILLSQLVPFVWPKPRLWWSSCHTSKSNDINIRNQRKPGCRPPRFSRGLESQGKYILDKSPDYPCISYY